MERDNPHSEYRMDRNPTMDKGRKNRKKSKNPTRNRDQWSARSTWEEHGELPDEIPIGGRRGGFYLLDRDGNPRSEGYHDISRMPDGTWVGRKGASWYLLNGDGNPGARGWHVIDKMPDGTWVGRKGANWYLLDDDGNQISEGYRCIEKKTDGTWVGEKGSKRYLLDDDGNRISEGYQRIYQADEWSYTSASTRIYSYLFYKILGVLKGSGPSEGWIGMKHGGGYKHIPSDRSQKDNQVEQVQVQDVKVVESRPEKHNNTPKTLNDD